MEITNTVEFYNKIINAESDSVLGDLLIQIQDSVLRKEITDEKDMMILNLAIQVKRSEFVINELIVSSVMDAIIEEDFDLEQAQLEQFQKEEYDEVEKGNVFTMKDFNKKDKE
jgi:hypothetical protein